MDMTQIPVPYFCIDRDYHILTASRQAEATFAEAGSLLDLLDEGSVDKAITYIAPSHANVKVELIMKTRSAPLALVDVYQSWDEEGTGHIVCICQSREFQMVTEQLHRLHEDLKEPERKHPAVKVPSGGGAVTMRIRELSAALTTIGELVDMLYPSLLEMNQTVYADIIKQQIDRALQEAAASFPQAGKHWPGR
ncbi:rsbT co-antagonist protein RsbR [Paenibacillus rhizosphaerae]|uniref:RsbT co-antagonist protein RsbR n=1 Tax=Paenibacillus rhizosphaerae TaxID=297318 RepID=A0A839TVU6_9BACL|nr:hypothetical protein [Paenibacillus rhizosphaerae]MBB3130631.1 rsbT co-antagonist protein RsbR [Paenibacillus rhizosphaerae]